ncbi:hypothetical protein OGAPHI_001832 [Ogataea philodendri]|uniref:Exportin-T n=1 Tax=Ogataea philodendri TaxID=1378263 RepID=A0A9P8P993_9ASCO|nr:uncharacterized protein OGAPHI_001832 [Ogataea philodendri]KAH3668078.1 hypothetical protein OGAPHI_001832 [Ogataea philodendri]
MDQQILQAVDIASSASADAQLKQQALDFISQIKDSPDGWQQCLNLLTPNAQLSPNVKFFVFQVLDARLPFMTDSDKITVKDYLFVYLKSLVDSNTVEPAFLRNALSKTFGILFSYATLTCYPSLIKDLISLAQPGGTFNELATDYYLRVLLVIHQEIGDQTIAREREHHERSNLLKDSIRANDMVLMTESWKNILKTYSNPDTQLKSDIINNTIHCIGEYISWIEINLILEQEYLGLLYQFLASPNTQHKITTAGCLNEILHKKMAPIKKLELINFLDLSSVLSQMDSKAKDADFDVNIAFAKLVENIGSELVNVLDSSSNEELANADFKNLTIRKILDIFPLVFDYLENEYDDVALEIFPFIGNFLLFLKKNITNEQIDFSYLTSDELLTTLLKKIIMRKRFDEDDDGTEDESIEQFQEVRNKLNSFHDSIVILNETLALEVMITCINESLFNSNSNWHTIELGMHELSHYSEILRNNVMNLPKTMINNSRPYFVFNEMLCKVIDGSTTFLVSHSLIQLLFFELVLKHYTFFTNSNIQVEGVNKEEILLKVLKIFVSNFGVFSDNEKVKYRSWYLFYRFIKLTKPSVDDYIYEELIRSLLPLLSFDFEVTNNAKISNDIDLGVVETNGSFEHQLYLFESLGLLITLIKKPEQRVATFESVLQPLFSNLEKCINNLSQLTLSVVVQVHHSLVSIGTILKGFESLHVQEFDEKFVALLQQISQVVLITLENFLNFNIVREASEFCVVRLFILLVKTPSAALEEVLSKFISIVMMNFDKLKLQEINNFLNFLGQVMHHCCKSQPVYLLLNSLLTPLISKVISRIETESAAAQDDFIKRDILDTQKSFISLLISMYSDHVSSLWLTNENKPALVNVINLMFNYIYNYQSNDLSLVKVAITCINSLLTGVGLGRVTDPEDVFKTDSNMFEEANQLLVTNALLLSCEMSFKMKRELLNDAQYRNSILLEVIRTMKAACFMGYELPDGQVNRKNKTIRFNEMMVEQLRALLVSSMDFPANLAQDFVEKLVELSDRQFLKYLIQLIDKM